MAKKERQVADATQKFQISILLSQHCEKIGNGLCAYKNDMSDAAIAEKVGCSPASVAHLRAANFGNLKAWTAAAPDEIAELKSRMDDHARCCDALANRIATLEKQNEQLHKDLAAHRSIFHTRTGHMIDRFNKAIEALKLEGSRVGHLKIDLAAPLPEAVLPLHGGKANGHAA